MFWDSAQSISDDNSVCFCFAAISLNLSEISSLTRYSGAVKQKNCALFDKSMKYSTVKEIILGRGTTLGASLNDLE